MEERSQIEQTRDDLLFEQELKQGIGENVPDAVIVVVSRRGGEIIWANREAEIMFGYTYDQMVGKGKTVEMLLPEDVRTTHVKHREDVYNPDPRPRSMGLGRNLLARDSDGTTFKVEVELKPFPTTRGTVTIAYVRRKLG